MQLHNLRLPTGEKRAIQIRDGRIAGITSGRTGGYSPSIDCQGCNVVPAGIDPHVHFRVPGGELKETWETGAQAALFGGVATVVDMPNTPIPLTSLERLDEKIWLIGRPPINYRLWFGATANNFDLLSDVADNPYVVGVKIYMGSSTGNLLITDDAVIEKICCHCADLELTVAIHAEDESLMQRYRSRLGRPPVIADHCQIRPTEVEVSAVRRALEIQRRSGCQMHFCHVSTPEAITLIAEAKAQHHSVTVEVCPHHWLFSEQVMGESCAAYRKMNPPLRSMAQAAEMRRHLCDPDLIDWVATDHAPHTRAEKDSSAYDAVPSGVPGVQDMMGLVYNLVLNGEITMRRFIKLTSGRAAEALGLRKGRIAVGYDADLLLIDPTHQVEIRQVDQKTKCGWSPYIGLSTAARRLIVVGGVLHHISVE